jgi:ankyrin repeat protein
MNDQDPMIARPMEVYRRALDVLESGDSTQLAALASELESFPHGEDPYIGRRWITNAIDVGSLATVRWVLSQGVDLSFRNDEGYTPLHSAIDRSLPDKHAVLALLLAAGAPVNRKGTNDWTPAHMAAARDDVEALRLLVRYGADLTIRTDIDDYATPLEEARNLRKLNAASYLETVV